MDLDGCTADDRWRRGLILAAPQNRGPDWPDKFHAYHEAAWRDRAMNLDQLIEGADIVIMTGRPLRYHALTMAWLVEVAGVEPLHVLHRNNHDTRPSVEVKRTQLGWLMTHYGIAKEQIVSAIDDMEAIVEMYRAAGLPARVVRVGEEEHVHG